MSGYFYRVQSSTPTRVWVNNPSIEDARAAIKEGAIACTTNPTYASKELSAEPEVSRVFLDEAFARAHDEEEAASLAQELFCGRLMRVFRPLYDADPEHSGFVSVQGSPLAEDHPEAIVEAAHRALRLGPNYIAKVPVTVAGLAAIRSLASEGTPIIATEVMSLSQALAVFEAWEEGARGTPKKAPFFITHITGVLEDWLLGLDSAALSPSELRAVCIAAAHRQYAVLRERGYRGRMLGGGARSTEHFTGMVGLEMDVTINWRGTADALLAADPSIDPIVSANAALVEKARAAFPGFDRAWREDGLSPGEFSDFGPVALFRSRFVEGWEALRRALRGRMSTRKE